MFDLSIIIVNYNKSIVLKECLDTIYKNTDSVNFEIFVIDNGSNDDSVPMVKQQFQKVNLIENPTNLGFAKANNRGIKTSQGKYILLLNNDTLIKNNALNKMVEFMENNPSIGGLGPKLLNSDQTIQRQGSILSRRFWKSKVPVETGFLTGAALMIRRKVFEKIGLLDEHFFFYNEDIDICKRIRKAGWKLYFLPEAEIIHTGQKTKNLEMIYEGYRGGLYLCEKYYNKPVNYLYRLLVLMDINLRIAFLSFKAVLSRDEEIDKEISQYEKAKKEIFAYAKD